MKVTDEQILAIKLQSDNGNVTVTQACKDQKIAPVTYYRRLEKLTAKSKNITSELLNVTNELPVTIQTIQAELGTIISNLKQMKPTNTRESLSIIDRQISALDKLNNTLKTTQILIDNRSVNIEVKEQTEREVAQWVYGRILENGGKELADKVAGWLGAE